MKCYSIVYWNILFMVTVYIYVIINQLLSDYSDECFDLQSQVNV